MYGFTQVELDRLRNDYQRQRIALRQVRNYLASEQAGLKMTGLQRGWMYETVTSALESTQSCMDEKREK